MTNSASRSIRLAASLLLATAVPTIAIAQTATSQPANGTPATTTTTDKSTAPTGGLEKTHQDWRSSKLVGASVFDTAGDSIGTIDDMLISKTGKVSDVVISVGGFLGIGDKLVEVPFGKLVFKPSKSNVANGSGNSTSGDYSLVLPHATKDSLKTMAAFTY